MLHFYLKGIQSEQYAFAVDRQYSSDVSSDSVQHKEQKDVDPYYLVQDDLKALCSNINQARET